MLPRTVFDEIPDLMKLTGGLHNPEGVLKFSDMTQRSGFEVLRRINRAAMHQDKVFRRNVLDSEERGHLDFFERTFQNMFGEYHRLARKVRENAVTENEIFNYLTEMQRQAAFWRSQEALIYDLLNQVEEVVQTGLTNLAQTAQDLRNNDPAAILKNSAAV